MEYNENTNTQSVKKFTKKFITNYIIGALIIGGLVYFINELSSAIFPESVQLIVGFLITILGLWKISSSAIETSLHEANITPEDIKRVLKNIYIFLIILLVINLIFDFFQFYSSIKVLDLISDLKNILIISLIANIIALAVQYAFIMMFCKSKLEEKVLGKEINKKLYIIILIIAVVILGAISILNKIDFTKEESENNINYIETIKNGMQNEVKSNDTLILVENNDKFGYINQKGEEIIPCEYDRISLATDLDIIAAKKDETYYILSKNGTVLYTNTNSPFPDFDEEEFNKEITEDIKSFRENIDKKELNNLIHTMIQYSIQANLENKEFDECEEYEKDFMDLIIGYYKCFTTDKENIEMIDMGQEMLYITNNKEKVNNLIIADAIDEINNVYKYNLNNGYILEIEENNQLVVGGKSNIQVKYNNEVINSINDVYTGKNIVKEYLSSDTEGTAYTYSNGDIPFFNIEQQVQGYISKKDGRIVSINGKYEIVDCVDNSIIIRDYNNGANTVDYIMNSETGEILLTAKEIKPYKQGYIVKNDNNKYVFANKNLEAKTPEFDNIELYANGNGLLVCQNNKNYELYALDGSKISNQKYQSIWLQADTKDIKGYILKLLYEKEYLGKDY